MKLEILHNPREELRREELRIGDVVYVTRIADSYEKGWENNWTHLMDDTVGITYKVTHITNERVTQVLLDNGFYYPIFVLERR